MLRNCLLLLRQVCTDPSASRSKHAAILLSTAACLTRGKAVSSAQHGLRSDLHGPADAGDACPIKREQVPEAGQGDAGVVDEGQCVRVREAEAADADLGAVRGAGQRSMSQLRTQGVGICAQQRKTAQRRLASLGLIGGI